MKAMILAAGLGSRMRPLTDHTPKPLLKVGNKPLIVWHIEKLSALGFEEIIINIAHLGYQIPELLGDGSQWGISLLYSDEQEEGGLESAGGIVKALALLGDKPFLVVNADVWTEYTFNPKTTLSSGVLAELILVPNPEHNLEGDFDLKEKKIIDTKKYTFSGIGYYDPILFKDLKYGKSALAPLLRKAIEKEQVTGTLYKGKWFDIGTPKRLALLNEKYQLIF